tara:strand:+ start:353 stop:1129 length:777 start_codon:yes stop_codon:yes gene_type:complete
MNKKQLNTISNKLVNAFTKNKLIKPIPTKFCKNIKNSNLLRRTCESKIRWPIIGFKAGGTALPLLKKLKEKEPFYGSVYSKNLLRSGKRVKINQYVLGIELEVCYLIKKNFFLSKQKISKNNITKFITHMAPCLEIVGYRQRKKGVKYLGDLCSDFGANIKFLIGKKTKFKKINIGNLNTYVKNNKNKEITNGNTSAVYINPLNSLIFVLKKIKRDKINLNKNFYIFTGSTVGIVPFTNKGTYIGKIEKLGSVKTTVY